MSTKKDTKACESSAFAQASAVVKGIAKNLSEISTFSFHAENVEEVMDMMSRFGPEFTIEDMRAELTGGMGVKSKFEVLEPKNFVNVKTGKVEKTKKPKKTALSYTVDGIIEEALLAEKHIRDYLNEDLELCHECMVEKHLPLIRALSKEGTSLTRENDEKEAFLSYSNSVLEMFGLINSKNRESIMSVQDKLRDIRKDIKDRFNKIEIKYPDVGVLSRNAMENGWIPEKGVSGLTEDFEAIIPENLRYWEKEDESERLELRNMVSEAILTGEIVPPVEANLSEVWEPPKQPEKPYIRNEELKFPHKSIWTYHQNSDRVEFDGTLLSYGAWNGYYYPPDAIDGFDARELVGKPIRYEHKEEGITKDVGKITEARNNLKEHSWEIKAWVDDPTVCALIRERAASGLSPRVFFKANNVRKTVEHIKRVEEGSIVNDPACKVCFIDHAA
jgi:hypothetical protein